MTLNDEIQTFLSARGADLVGFADLFEINADVRDDFTSGISIAISLNPLIISEVSDGPTSSYVEDCFRADRILKSLGKLAVEYLTSKGYRAKQLTVTNTTGTEYPPNLTTKLPHKTIATRAGLGWIGKCALLITREFGSAVRLGSVLTDARLSSGVPINISQCEDCNVCVGVCPAGAITGQEWYAGIARDALIDAFTCQKTARELLIERTSGEITGRTFCGICLAVCPWTKQYIEKV